MKITSKLGEITWSTVHENIWTAGKKTGYNCKPILRFDNTLWTIWCHVVPILWRNNFETATSQKLKDVFLSTFLVFFLIFEMYSYQFNANLIQQCMFCCCFFFTVHLHHTNHGLKHDSDKNLTLSKCSVCTCSLFPRMCPMYALFNASSKSWFDAQPPYRNRTQQTKA